MLFRSAGIAAAEDEGEGPRPEIVVRDRIGRVLLDASSLPPLEFDDAKAHFHSMAHAGETWRVYQRWDAARRHWIQVAAPLLVEPIQSPGAQQRLALVRKSMAARASLVRKRASMVMHGLSPKARSPETNCNSSSSRSSSSSSSSSGGSTHRL